MNTARQEQKLGLEPVLQHPDALDAERIPRSRGEHGEVLYPEVDADGDHVRFEMVRMEGDSLLWLTVRRETPLTWPRPRSAELPICSTAMARES
jgi:hypothetical protein